MTSTRRHHVLLGPALLLLGAGALACGGLLAAAHTACAHRGDAGGRFHDCGACLHHHDGLPQPVAVWLPDAPTACGPLAAAPAPALTAGAPPAPRGRSPPVAMTVS